MWMDGQDDLFIGASSKPPARVCGCWRRRREGGLVGEVESCSSVRAMATADFIV